MRITIEGTQEDVGYYSKVTVEDKHDDLSIGEVTQLMKQALAGYGFSEELINQYIKGD